MSTENDPRELIGAYVLGSCTPEEATIVREEMIRSAAFREEVESFDPVREALLLVPAYDPGPSPDVRSRLLAQVQEEASLFSAAGTGRRDEAATPSADDAPRTAGRSTVDGERPAPDAPRGTAQSAVDAPRATGPAAEDSSPRRSGFLGALRHPARAIALASVLVVLVVAGIVVGSGGGNDGREYPGETLGAVQGTSATARMVAVDGDARLEVEGFPAAGAGKKYQVWLQTGKQDPKPTRVLFNVDDAGRAEAEIPESLSGVDNVLVTAEPAAGSQAPTSTPVLKVSVNRRTASLPGASPAAA